MSYAQNCVSAGARWRCAAPPSAVPALQNKQRQQLHTATSHCTRVPGVSAKTVGSFWVNIILMPRNVFQIRELPLKVLSFSLNNTRVQMHRVLTKFKSTDMTYSAYRILKVLGSGSLGVCVVSVE